MLAKKLFFSGDHVGGGGPSTPPGWWNPDESDQGNAYTWGENTYGQMEDNTGVSVPNGFSSSPLLTSGTDWVMVASGWGFHMAIKADGTLWGVGRNDQGQLGTGDKVNRTSWTLISAATDWFYINCGDTFTVARRQNGTLWSCGSGGAWLGHGDTMERTLLTQIGTDTNWDEVECGTNHCLAIKQDGTLWSWGEDESGQLGRTEDLAVNTVPGQIATVNATVYVKSLSMDTAIGHNGVTATGDSPDSKPAQDAGENAPEGPDVVSNPTYEKTFPVKKWVKLICGDRFSAAINASGVRKQSFNLNNPITTIDGSDLIIVNDPGHGSLAGEYIFIDDVTDFNGHSLRGEWKVNTVLDVNSYSVRLDTFATASGSGGGTDVDLTYFLESGDLYTWGNNTNGNLGHTTYFDNIMWPTKFNDDNDWRVVAAGDNYMMSIKANGNLWGWGENGSGQLGTGAATGLELPQPVSLDTDWTDVKCGNEASFMMKSNGTLWNCGKNTFGQLGRGTITVSEATIGQLGSDTDWIRTSKPAILGTTDSQMIAVKKL